MPFKCIKLQQKHKKKTTTPTPQQKQYVCLFMFCSSIKSQNGNTFGNKRWQGHSYFHSYFQTYVRTRSSFIYKFIYFCIYLFIVYTNLLSLSLTLFVYLFPFLHFSLKYTLFNSHTFWKRNTYKDFRDAKFFIVYNEAGMTTLRKKRW